MKIYAGGQADGGYHYPLDYLYKGGVKMAIGRTNAARQGGDAVLPCRDRRDRLPRDRDKGNAERERDGGKWLVRADAPGGRDVDSNRDAGRATSDTKTVSVVDSYAVTLTFFSATITVTAPSGAVVTLKKGGSTVDSKTSTGTVVFTVYETGEYTVEATQGGQSTSGTVNVVSSTTSYAITLSFVSDTLNENSWDTISEVSDAGEGANYWAIGDRKQVTLNGNGREPLPLEFLDLRFYHRVQSQLGAGRVRAVSTSSLQRRPSPAVRTFALPTGSTSILAPRRRSA